MNATRADLDVNPYLYSFAFWAFGCFRKTAVGAGLQSFRSSALFVHSMLAYPMAFDIDTDIESFTEQLQMRMKFRVLCQPKVARISSRCRVHTKFGPRRDRGGQVRPQRRNIRADKPAYEVSTRGTLFKQHGNLTELTNYCAVFFAILISMEIFLLWLNFLGSTGIGPNPFDLTHYDETQHSDGFDLDICLSHLTNIAYQPVEISYTLLSFLLGNHVYANQTSAFGNIGCLGVARDTCKTKFGNNVSTVFRIILSTNLFMPMFVFYHTTTLQILALTSTMMTTTISNMSPSLGLPPSILQVLMPSRSLPKPLGLSGKGIVISITTILVTELLHNRPLLTIGILGTFSNLFFFNSIVNHMIFLNLGGFWDG